MEYEDPGNSQNLRHNLEYRRLCGLLYDIEFSSSKNPVSFDLRVRLQACGMLRRLMSTGVKRIIDSKDDLLSSLNELISRSFCIFEVIADHQELAMDDEFMKMCSVTCLLISSKIFDSHPLTMTMLRQVPSFADFNVPEVELTVLKLLRFDVARVRSVQILEIVSELLAALKGILNIAEGDLYGICGDILHITSSNLGQTALVLDNVSNQLGAAACIATAYSLHEDGGTMGTLLYVLASQCTESSWDVGDLQLVTNALLDQILDECTWHRFSLRDSSEDMLRILRNQ